MDWWKKASDQL
jgi:hypothetical protein